MYTKLVAKVKLTIYICQDDPSAVVPVVDCKLSFIFHSFSKCQSSRRHLPRHLVLINRRRVSIVNKVKVQCIYICIYKQFIQRYLTLFISHIELNLRSLYR